MSRLAQKFVNCKREMFGGISNDVQEIKAQLQALFSLMEGGVANGNEASAMLTMYSKIFDFPF